MKDVVRFEELGVETRNGPRRVCVVNPQQNILLTRERLDRLGDGALTSDLDRLIYAHLEADGGYHGLIFRGCNDEGTVRYGLADEVANDVDLVANLLEAHMRFFRAIEAIGVFSMVGVGFSDQDRIAYETAAELLADRLTKQLADAEASQAKELQLTQWLVDRQAMWTSMPFEAFVEHKLVPTIVAAERQRSRLHQG